MHHTSTRHGHHAIIVGASISGLLAARIVSEHFDRVTLLDRDTLPSGIDNRSGVPQGRHGHGLLASGFRGLKELFPSLEQELLDAGAVPGDIIGSVRWFQHGHYKARFASGLNGLLLSRPLLEGTIRRLISSIPNVTITADTHVAGLLREGNDAAGVRLKEQSIPADIVIDASGRGSRAPAWLAELEYGTPAVEQVRVDIAYTTRTFRRGPGDLGGDIGAVIAPKPPHEMRAGFALAMEGGRWMVGLAGWLGHHAPADPEGYLAFAKSLARPDIYHLIKDAEPLTDAVKYAFPSNLRRRYDRLKRFPERFLVIGDALCSFNPLYGQGMSVATLEAFALAECLRRARSLDGLWRPFFKAAARVIDTPWTIAAGNDFAFEGVTGDRPSGCGLVNWYLDYVHRAASLDPSVCRTFFDVANLLEPAPTLFSPRFVAKVVKACARRERVVSVTSPAADTKRMVELLTGRTDSAPIGNGKA